MKPQNEARNSKKPSNYQKEEASGPPQLKASLVMHKDGGKRRMRKSTLKNGTCEGGIEF